MVEHLPCNEGIRLLLTPNRSISWRGVVRVWLGLVTVSLAVAVGMALAGAWVVLPFAGLELTALAAALYYTARKCQRQEVLVIAPESLRLEKGRVRKEAEWELPRRSTRVHVDPADHPWTPARFYLMHRDVAVSLASFLNVEDSEKLLGILESQGLTIERGAQPFSGFWF